MIGRDPSELAHQPQRARDRLARRAGPAGELVLAERQLDPSAAGRAGRWGAVLGREIEQALGDPADAVAGREVDDVAGGVRQTADEHPDHHERRVGVLAQEGRGARRRA